VPPPTVSDGADDLTLTNFNALALLA